MRHKYLDWLRVTCAVAVIANHVLSHYLNSFSFKGGMWTASMMLIHLQFFCIPAFFMISGALLIKPLDGMTYREYLKKRFLRIVIPFTVWSVIHWLIVCVWMQGKPLAVTEFIKLFLSNGICSQYWYVYATMILYLFLPFLGKLVTSLSRKQLWTLIAVMVIANLVLPYINEILKAFTKWKITNYNMSSIGAYLTYALIGYALHTMELPAKKDRYLMYAAGFGSWLLMNGLCWFNSDSKYSRALVEMKYPPACIMAVAVFLAFKVLCNKHPKLGESKIIGILSSESFTAYLAHMLCLRVLQVFWTQKKVVLLGSFRSAGIMLMEWIFAIVGSFGIAWLAHRLPKKISRLL